MITLCGIPLSNYYNKVKLALLEKGIPFTEEYVKTHSHAEDVLSASPLGKVPFIKTPQGALCESQVIVDYLEAAYPDTPRLIPADPYQAAKVRELIVYVDLHLELVARELYAEAFFGGKVSDGTKQRVARVLPENIKAFKRLAKFGPYLAGDSFTMADCAGWVSLPLVGMATKIVYGEDLLAADGVDWKPYAKLIGERPHAQTVAADRKADQERSFAAKS
ncbi:MULTISPECIES: glutathione S-transferase [unclassified Roseateles]|uniref:glutathione S-transferase n=1 Tax=unclassified Roseateles TaxID=2626991 RepID=UPI0006F5D9D9|nr:MULTISPECIES: glutathione S-transferase [unclassified Roseateles]KQW45776.1 glutathione S-transferase [Pelomonas sp. Root405]KRA72620.1 glutathione S-transferase [Pelomonas sp. Root662]